MITVNVPFNITSQQLADWFTTAFEGGSNYWLMAITPAQHKSNVSSPWYSDAKYYDEEMSSVPLFYVTYPVDDDDDEAETIAVSKDNISRGLVSAPEPALRNLVTDHVDDEEADSLLQMVCFGEIRFG
jgi:hypothetical protein